MPESPDAEKALGRALLLICALAKAVDVDPELALNEAADAFVNRFEALEQELLADGVRLPDDGGAVKEYWDRVKLRENM